MSENETTEAIEVNNGQNYIDELNKLRLNTVQKSEYERVVKENATLAAALATQPATAVEAEETHYTQKDIDDLSASLSKHSQSNLEYVTKMLAYRDAVMDVHGVDPLVPYCNGKQASDEECQKAESIAEGLKAMVTYANGNPALFNSELKRCCR